MRPASTSCQGGRSRYAFVFLLSIAALSPMALADFFGTGQYTLGTLSSTPLQVGVSAEGTFTISGCECSPQQEFVRATALVGTADGGNGLLTLVNDHAAFGEVALRINDLLRVGAESYNTPDEGFGRLVVNLNTVVIGNQVGGNRFSPNESAEFGGPASHPAEAELRGRMVAFDLVTVGHYGDARFDMIGPLAEFSPNGLTIGDHGYGEFNLLDGASFTIAGLDFATIGNAGQLNIIGEGSAAEAQAVVTLRGNGDGAYVNVYSGGRFTVFAHASQPDNALIEGIGGGFYSPAHLNVLHDNLALTPPRVESIDMAIRHTQILVNGPGAIIDLSGTFSTFSAGQTPSQLRIINGGQMTCAAFLAAGYNYSISDPDVFAIDGVGSSLTVDGELGLAVGDTIRAKMTATNGAAIEAGPVVICEPATAIRTEGHLELSGGSTLVADSIDLANTNILAFPLEGSLRVCDTSVVTVSGAVTLGQFGVLQGSGTVIAGGGVHNNGGTVIGGCSPGDLHIDGDYDQPAGTLVVGVGSATNRLLATGSVTIAGKIEAQVRGDILPDTDLSVELIEGDGGVSIDPATQILLSMQDVSKYMSAEITPTASGVMMTVAPKPGRANYDFDQDTDLTDYFYLTDCMRGPAGGGCGSSTDLDGDSDTDLRDAWIFMLSFGEVQ